MAPKRNIPVKDLTSDSEELDSYSVEDNQKSMRDGNEDEETDSQDEYEISVGEEDKGSQKLEKNSQKSRPSLSSKPHPSKSQREHSESESDSGSDSESLSPKAVANSNLKPSLLKPVDAPSKAGHPRKRGADVVVDGGGKEQKLPKKEAGVHGGEKPSQNVKKQLFQRVWSEEDEVALLEGLINFGGNKGVEAIKDIGLFYEFIKKDLHVEMSLSQLKDKLFRLKKKFDNNRKGKKGGEGKTFSNVHDQKIFDLSKRIWGSEVKSKGKSKANMNEKELKMKMNVSGGGGSINMNIESKNVGELKLDLDSNMEAYVVKKSSELMQGAKKAKMQETLQQLQVEELELFLKKTELVIECTKVMLAAYDDK